MKKVSPPYLFWFWTKTTLKKLSEFLTLVAVGFEKTDEFEVEGEYEYEREHVDGHRGGRDIDDDEEDEEDGTVFRVFPFFRKRVSKS